MDLQRQIVRTIKLKTLEIEDIRRTDDGIMPSTRVQKAQEP